MRSYVFHPGRGGYYYVPLLVVVLSSCSPHRLRLGARLFSSDCGDYLCRFLRLRSSLLRFFWGAFYFSFESDRKILNVRSVCSPSNAVTRPVTLEVCLVVVKKD